MDYYNITKLKELRIKYPILEKYYKISELLTNIILLGEDKYIIELEQILKEDEIKGK